MVLKRRIDYGFTGYSASDIPRAPRSVRKRSLHKKTVEDGQLCAFDLLATVAGKLLQESESSSTASCAAMGIDQYEACLNAIEPEKLGMDNPVRTENDDQGSSEESGFYSGLCLQSSDNKGTHKETASETVAENGSNVASSASSGKSDSDVKPITPKSGDKSVKIHCKVEEDIPKWGETFSITTEDGGIKQSEFSVQMDEDLTATNKFSAKDSADLFRKFPAGTTCNKNLEFPVCKDTPPSPSLFRYRNDVKIGGRDDDEILSRSQLNAKAKACGPPARVGDRIRKLLTSKYWKVAPKLKESEPSNSGTKLKHNYNDRKSWYSHAQSECVTPFKKRKLFDHSSGVSFDGGISSQSVSNCPDKHTEDRKNGSAEKLPEGKNASPSNMGHQRSFNSRNCPVKFTIKSFKVPELFIEVPESTTVGSLKRTVLEAVTAIIGDGLRVGVFLEGKKIRDDNKTLLQSGISLNDNSDSLGFMLEPISPRSPSLSPEGPLAPLKCVSPKDVKRTQVFTKESSFPGDGPNKSLVTDSGCQGGGNQELIPSPAADELTSKTAPDSKALVSVSEANIEALAIVSSSHRPKRSEIGQRRTRRPFSVSEVEALVQAVEKLGTGRWRDVKLCAFENAKHRTYVDLKDKWKTLVHTARISPQQRRGEPVPQELLDRVLAAHALWSQHQAKQHGKQQQQPGLLRLTDNLALNDRAAAA